MSNVLGFSLEKNAGGDFLPICKYDARAGRIFRIDRMDTGNGFANNPVDITPIFKAVIDLDNIQTGWIDFLPGAAPSFVLVPLAELKSGKIALPDKPGIKHKHGVRFMLKLHPSCGGDKHVREMAGTSNAFLNGIAALYEEFTRTRGQYPGMLPVITMTSATPIKSGSGVQSSTNYQPAFHIGGWARRPEDLHATVPPLAAPPVQPLPPTAPVTGSVTVPPPNKLAPAPFDDDDFG